MRCVLVEIGRPRRAHAQPLDGFTMPRRRHRVEMRAGRANISKEWPARRFRIACDVGKPRDRSIAVLCVRVRSTDTRTPCGICLVPTGRGRGRTRASLDALTVAHSSALSQSCSSAPPWRCSSSCTCAIFPTGRGIAAPSCAASAPPWCLCASRAAGCSQSTTFPTSRSPSPSSSSPSPRTFFAPRSMPPTTAPM